MVVTGGAVRLQHVALNVRELESCEHFYVALLGMRVAWRPDADNVYLTSGCDNLALHRSREDPSETAQRLDHIGFALESGSSVEAWHDRLRGNGVVILAPPRTHRDGARSFYCEDPAGNTVQLLYDPRAVDGSEPEARGEGLRIAS